MKHCAKTVGLTQSGSCLKSGTEGFVCASWVVGVAPAAPPQRGSVHPGVIGSRVTGSAPRVLIGPLAAPMCAPLRPGASQAPDAQ